VIYPNAAITVVGSGNVIYVAEDYEFVRRAVDNTRAEGVGDPTTAITAPLISLTMVWAAADGGPWEETPLSLNAIYVIAIWQVPAVEE
jgi:hypothetical protein